MKGALNELSQKAEDAKKFVSSVNTGAAQQQQQSAQ
jgi:hypothetical protein